MPLLGVVDDRQKLQITPIGGTQQYPEYPQAVDGFLHRREFHHRFAVALFYLAVVFEKGDVLQWSEPQK